MEHGHKILIWFRESLSLENNCSLLSALKDSIEIIPVFCFDPREYDLKTASFIPTGFLKDQIQSVAALRNELQVRGSNLLVVGQPYEKIIPSLARVLNINKVITNELTEPEKSAFPELTIFRNQKAREVGRLLLSHSIPVLFEGSAIHLNVLPDSFPRFPEINPGMIPPPR